MHFGSYFKKQQCMHFFSFAFGLFRSLHARKLALSGLLSRRVMHNWPKQNRFLLISFVSRIGPHGDDSLIERDSPEYRIDRNSSTSNLLSALRRWRVAVHRLVLSLVASAFCFFLSGEEEDSATHSKYCFQCSIWVQLHSSVSHSSAARFDSLC